MQFGVTVEESCDQVAKESAMNPTIKAILLVLIVIGGVGVAVWGVTSFNKPHAAKAKVLQNDKEGGPSRSDVKQMPGAKPSEPR